MLETVRGKEPSWPDTSEDRQTGRGQRIEQSWAVRDTDNTMELLWSQKIDILRGSWTDGTWEYIFYAKFLEPILTWLRIRVISEPGRDEQAEAWPGGGADPAVAGRGGQHPHLARGGERAHLQHELQVTDHLNCLEDWPRINDKESQVSSLRHWIKRPRTLNPVQISPESVSCLRGSHKSWSSRTFVAGFCSKRGCHQDKLLKWGERGICKILADIL